MSRAMPRKTKPAPTPPPTIAPDAYPVTAEFDAAMLTGLDHAAAGKPGTGLDVIRAAVVYALHMAYLHGKIDALKDASAMVPR